MSLWHRGVMIVCIGLLCAAFVQPVSAGEEWCWDDPSLVALGQTVGFEVLLPRNSLAQVDDVALEIAVPSGLPAQARPPRTSPYHLTYTVGVLRVDHAHGDVAPAPWTPGQPVTVQVTLTVKARANVPVRVRASLNQASGLPLGSGVALLNLDATSAHPLTASFTLPGAKA